MLHLMIISAVYMISVGIILYYTLLLLGIELKYVFRYLLNKELRRERSILIRTYNNVLNQELNLLLVFIRDYCNNIPPPKLIVDFRFEEIPGGRYIPPKYIFIQHTDNLERLRKTIRHELIHHIHWHCLRYVIPWSKREEFAKKVCELLRGKESVTKNGNRVLSCRDLLELVGC